MLKKPQIADGDGDYGDKKSLFLRDLRIESLNIKMGVLISFSNSPTKNQDIAKKYLKLI